MPRSVPRVAGLTQAAFLEQYVRPGRPVIVSDGARGWPALTRWTPDYLRKAEEQLRVWVQFVDDRLFHFEAGVMRLIRFSHYVDLLTTRKNPAERAYLQGFPISEAPTLGADLGVPALIPPEQLRQSQLWLGGGATIPLHFDNFNTLLTQVLGRKRVRLFPPGIRDYYPRPLLSRSWQTSRIELERADRAAFPRFPFEAQWDAEFGPGEMLFIPLFWWHHVEHEGLTASISYGFRDGIARDLALTETGRRVALRSVLEPVAMTRLALEARRKRRTAIAGGRTGAATRPPEAP